MTGIDTTAMTAAELAAWSLLGASLARISRLTFDRGEPVEQVDGHALRIELLRIEEAMVTIAERLHGAAKAGE